MMSGKKMDRSRALAVLYYNYPTLTVDEDTEWTEYMVDMLCRYSGDKREACKAHGMKYPPKRWMEEYFKS